MSKYLVLITPRSFGGDDSSAAVLLRENGCELRRLKAAEGPLEKQLEHWLPLADAVIAGLEPYTAELLEKANQLRVISRYGVGYETVDLAAAKARGIAVTTTPGANSDSVADLAVALMLDCARNVTQMCLSMRLGRNDRPVGLEMREKTVGVLGAGRIGKGVARRCRGFDMRVLCCDEYEDEAFQRETGAEYVSLERLLKESDFISVHTPLTPETENMISAQQFAMMRESAILVNTARGGIVDETALYEALTTGQIRAAALDALADESAGPGKLARLPNCILTPHAGAATVEAGDRMGLLAARNVLDVLEGRACRFRV